MMKITLATLISTAILFPNILAAQQETLRWSHVYTKEGSEITITEFHAPVDSVLLKYECWPDTKNHLELRLRPLVKGVVADSSYISCPDSVKITAQTTDSIYIDYVPEKMLRQITEKEHPGWFKKK
jgi:hypothetical protein